MEDLSPCLFQEYAMVMSNLWGLNFFCIINKIQCAPNWKDIKFPPQNSISKFRAGKISLFVEKTKTDRKLHPVEKAEIKYVKKAGITTGPKYLMSHM
jgi:hypothetical protein